jgi:hypothetical protein
MKSIARAAKLPLVYRLSARLPRGCQVAARVSSEISNGTRRKFVAGR